MMLRWLIAILLVANLVALAAIEGLFGPPPAAGAREPAHLAQQVRPEALRVSAAAQAAETPVVGGPITSPAIEVQPLGASAPNAASGSGPASEAAGASGAAAPAPAPASSAPASGAAPGAAAAPGRHVRSRGAGGWLGTGRRPRREARRRRPAGGRRGPRAGGAGRGPVAPRGRQGARQAQAAHRSAAPQGVARLNRRAGAQPWWARTFFRSAVVERSNSNGIASARPPQVLTSAVSGRVSMS